MNSVILELDRKLGKHRRSGREFTYCCPYCKYRKKSKDTHYHLYINLDLVINEEKGWFNCYRCSVTGPIRFLLGDKHKVDNTTNLKNWKQVVNQKLIGVQKEEIRPKKADLPLDYDTLFIGSMAHQYLLSRGLVNADINFYQIGCGSKDLRGMEKSDRQSYAGSGRIIFPDFDEEGNCIFWVARSYVGHQIKYKNCSASARDKIYNYSYVVNNHKTIIITEGPISAIMAARNAVGIYGKGITEEQIRILLNGKFDHYIFALDGDLKARNYFFLNRFMGCKCSRVELKGKEDPASIDDFTERVRLAKVVTSKTLVSLL